MVWALVGRQLKLCCTANAVQELLPVLLPTETRDQKDQFWGLEKVKTPRSDLALAKLQCWGVTSWCW